MTTRAVEQVDDWDARSFSGGYSGLHDLADEGFSGIVAAGPTRLCMTSGKVIGVLDGTIADFEDASGTAYESPSPALPLLAVMQDRSDEVRAQYYTEETSVEEVDRTLTQGNFTGYVELSENVLSGDYYLVYHQGRSMSVAWVGASDNLLIEDEAFDQANDEVGIYEVRPVDIEVIEIPEATGAATGGDADTDDGGTASEAAGTGAAATAATTDPEEPESATADDEPTADEAGAPDSDAGESAADEPGRDEPEDEESGAADPDEVEVADAEATDDSDARADESDAGTAGGSAAGGETTDSGAESREERRSERSRDDPSGSRRQESGGRGGTDAANAGGGSRRTEATGQSPDPQPRQPRSEPQEPAGRSQRDAGQRQAPERNAPSGPRSGSAGTPSGGSPRSSSTGDVADLETRSIPSLDPDRTNEPGSDDSDNVGPTPVSESAGARADAGSGPAAAGSPEPSRASGTATQPEQHQSRQPQPEPDPDDAPAQGGRGAQQSDPTESEPAPETGAGGADPAEIEELEAELDEREAEIEDLEAELETVSDERDELAAERDELEARVEQLERRIDELRTEEGGESVADRERLGPGEAIQGTNLFVRYESKGEATLDGAHAGTAEASAVNDNLQLQYHTQFEADDVAVNGEPFADFLTDTIQYRFVEWVVRVLPYEIRDTGHQEALGPLYDALPQIDRADLNGAITVQYEENGESHRSQESFDVILRDRMGNPLIVANMNESRQPASQGMMEGLISAGQRVGESKESLSGAFLVTSSFFEPEAMEAAADATGSGLLSRDKRESFVKLSRKDGFHLCLVEAREEKFNLSVPEI